MEQQSVAAGSQLNAEAIEFTPGNSINQPNLNQELCWLFEKNVTELVELSKKMKKMSDLDKKTIILDILLR